MWEAPAGAVIVEDEAAGGEAKSDGGQGRAHQQQAERRQETRRSFTRHDDEDGDAYFVDAESGVSLWNLPAGGDVVAGGEDKSDA